jgi:4-amino-4-deoxy-L-arabinose transferase-like glycosyltransferase
MLKSVVISFFISFYMHQSLFTLRTWICLYAFAIIITLTGLFSPVLNSNDAYFYAVISKAMVTQHNWIDLYYMGSDWLDKPHLPFWLTALSFKLFGVTPTGYVLPGLLFHFIGAYYTYRLACELFDGETGKLAGLIYLTSLHLLLSAIDVRAEAFLLGEITPACYYWLCYSRYGKLSNLLLASMFTGLALMTKGLFVLVTIFSGLSYLLLIKRQISSLLKPKWLIAYGLILIAVLPELICLYLQFDSHPEKLVFGKHGVSGIKWFFWGSQFGRFFNSGPIVNQHGNPWFFVHTMLWATLPWSIVLIGAFAAAIRHCWKKSKHAASFGYLLISFSTSFVMFSATKFQLDHYTNILIPFAAILCSKWLLSTEQLRKLAWWQYGLACGLLLVLIVLSCWLMLVNQLTLLIVTVGLTCLIGGIYFYRQSAWQQIIFWPTLAIGIVFSGLQQINSRIYPQFDAGYQVAQSTKFYPESLPLNIYQPGAWLNQVVFNCNNPVQIIKSTQLIAAKNSWLLIPLSEISHLQLPPGAQLVRQISIIPQEKFIPALFSSRALSANLVYLNLYLIK